RVVLEPAGESGAVFHALAVRLDVSLYVLDPGQHLGIRGARDRAGEPVRPVAVVQALIALAKTAHNRPLCPSPARPVLLRVRRSGHLRPAPRADGDPRAPGMPSRWSSARC